MLHLINKPLLSTASSLLLVQAMDVILWLEDGVYNAVSNNPVCEQLLQRKITCYALADDVHARGILQQLHPTIHLMTDEAFVDLSLAHSSNISW